MNSKRLHDIVLIVICILIAGFSYLAINIFSSDTGNMVVVKADGEIVAQMPIDKDTTFRYEAGDDINIIIIKNTRVYISEANCSNEECVNQGSIGHAGQSIVCLPHKLVITIESEKDDNDVDGVVR